jgi:two-component sensor histidine kinase
LINPKIIFQIVFAVTLGLFLDLTSQNKHVDSLLHLLKIEKKDSIRLLILNDLSEATEDIDETLKYNQEVIAICKKNLPKAKLDQRDFYLLRYSAGLVNIGYTFSARNNYEQAVKNYLLANTLLEQMKSSSEDAKLTHAYLCNNLSSVYRDQGKIKESQVYVKKAVKLFEMIDDPEGLAMAYSNLAGEYTASGNMDSSMVFYNKSIEVYKKINNSNGIATVYNNIGDYYDKIGNKKEAIKNYNSALEEIKKGNNKNSLAYIQQNLGISYGEVGNTEVGLKFLFAAAQLFRELEDKKGQYFALSNIGGIYYRAKDYVSAEKYFKESADAASEIEFTSGIATTYYRLGNIESKKGNAASAYSYFSKSIELCKKTEKYRTLADVYNSLGELCKSQKSSDSAEYFYNAALKTAEPIKYNLARSTALIALSDLFFNKGKVIDAQKLAEKGFELTKELGNIVEQKNASNLLYKIYKQLGNSNKALEMHEYYTKMADSLKSEEAQKAIIRSQIHQEYLALKVRDSLNNIQKDSARERSISEKEEELNHAGKLKTALLFLLAASIIVGSIIYWRYLKKSKLHKQIQEQNTLLEAKNKEKELLMHEIHHRVKNNLQIVSSLLKMPQKQINDNDAKEIMDESRQRIHSISLIHKLLYENENVKEVNSNQYFKELCETIVNSLSVPDQKIKLELGINEIKVAIDDFVPLALILNELLLNSLKYAFSGVQQPLITVKFEKNNGQYSLIYSDNGENDVSEKIKAKNSFGTQMIFNLAKQLNGLINVTFNKGTKIELEFPEAKA